MTIAGCGDEDVTVRSSGTVPAGFFIGQTATGGNLSIAVGSIRAVFFRCGSVIVSQRFSPPEPVAVDGSLAVEIAANGVHFTVTGQLVGDDRIDGAIATATSSRTRSIRTTVDRALHRCDGNVIDNTFCAEDVCTCDDFCDGPGGTLSCNADCTVNFSHCTTGGCSF